MKVIDGTFIAIWCAARLAAPKVPITSVAALNIIASKIVVMPMGRPRRKTSASSCHTGRQKRRKMRYLRKPGVQ